jgi:hypothetical protein
MLFVKTSASAIMVAEEQRQQHEQPTDDMTVNTKSMDLKGCLSSAGTSGPTQAHVSLLLTGPVTLPHSRRCCGSCTPATQVTQLLKSNIYI